MYAWWRGLGEGLPAGLPSSSGPSRSDSPVPGSGGPRRRPLCPYLRWGSLSSQGRPNQAKGSRVWEGGTAFPGSIWKHTAWKSHVPHHPPHCVLGHFCVGPLVHTCPPAGALLPEGLSPGAPAVLAPVCPWGPPPAGSCPQASVWLRVQARALTALGCGGAGAESDRGWGVPQGGVIPSHGGPRPFAEEAGKWDQN